MRAAFREAGDAAEADPLLNPVQSLASQLFLALEKGAADPASLGPIIEEFERDSFEARAAAFHANLADDDDDAAAFEALSSMDFGAFQKAVEQASVGVVFTAHPTFALSSERRGLIAKYPSAEKTAWRARVSETRAGPAPAITLIDEHDEAMKAIAFARDGVADLNGRILALAQKRFPKEWRKIAPTPISVATWVGYDLDGRTDIQWGQTVALRLAEKATQLERYVGLLDEIGLADSPQLSDLRETLRIAGEATRRHADMFTGDLSDPEVVVAAANALTNDKHGRLTSLNEAIETIGAAIEAETSDDKALSLSLLRSEMLAFGLGVSRIHLRVNAAQVRSALRNDLGLDPDKEFQGRSALDKASTKAGETDARAVNFGSVFLEQMTARRQFMLCAQILKHIDADTPLRFLIAECEAPATVMGAIYLARLYGVDHKLDISPLFETPQALEGGGRFIERLLAEPEYQAYVKKRGRMSIQIGYSDSGRFMGQATASLGAERLQVLFARALGKARLPDVEALIFNTHGESMGRGAFPGGYRERMAHLSTPWVRSRFRREGVNLAAEFSFQGGEGYLHFQTQALARNAISTLWSLGVEPPPPDFSDRYYDDINYSWDIYRALKGWQETLYAREDYRDVIFSFAQNLLYKTGSREVKRATRNAGPPEIRSIRAIPHNAILQQLGLPVNVSGGIGAASGREVDRFVEHTAGSPRMRGILKMTARARDLTSVSILRAYAGLFEPAYWSSLAGMARRSERSEQYESVLQVLQLENISRALSGLADFLARDMRAYDAVRDEMGETSRSVNGAGIDADLGVLHALRQALIGRAAALVAQAPAFSRRHDVNRNDIIELALEMRLKEAASILERIFPKDSPAGAALSNLKEPVEKSDGHGGAYPEIHEKIIKPLLEIDECFFKISAAIANHYRAYG